MPKLLSLGDSPAHNCACRILSRQGFVIEKTPSNAIQGILLDIPSPLEILKDGLLPHRNSASQIPLFCGNLSGAVPPGYRIVDLLKDPEYTARNGDITARCAIALACGSLPKTLLGLPVLVIGWGRIGKCLGKLLTSLGAQCYIYARKAEDRAILSALGYNTVNRNELLALLPELELVMNTAPEPVLDAHQAASCPGILMDLASRPGIAGDRVIPARGLPGRIAPESAGALLAQTVIRLWKEETT